MCTDLGKMYVALSSYTPHMHSQFLYEHRDFFLTFTVMNINVLQCSNMIYDTAISQTNHPKLKIPKSSKINPWFTVFSITLLTHGNPV